MTDRTTLAVFIGMLIAMLAIGCALAGTVRLAWDAPTQDADGGPIAAGTPLYYRVYTVATGVVPVVEVVATITSGNTSVTTDVVNTGRRSVVVTAAWADEIGAESSPCSNLVVNFSKPSPPKGLRK